MAAKRPVVAIVFNDVDPDEYAELRNVDPDSLGFETENAIEVATVLEEYEAVRTALSKVGYRAELFNMKDDVDRLIGYLRKRRPDVVFNLVEHVHDKSGLELAVAGLYDLLGIPFTGSGPLALGICQRKGMTKQLLLANGVRTPRFHLLDEPALRRRHGLHFPIIIKPSREDASVGVDAESVVYDQAQLHERVAVSFADFGAPILVEEFIEGRELHVAVLGNDPPTALPILEYELSKLPSHLPRIISYAGKWDPLQEEFHRVESICPARLSRQVERRVREAALVAYRLTSCRDYARIDARLSKDSKVYILEVNPNPDLTEEVSYMECAAAAGMSFGQTLKAIVEMALSRRQ
ncbi:MAG: ATP-grasp domain-containing protein, partial [Gemmatimonadaceae bacterium]